MNAYSTYQTTAPVATSRIDLLLALFDGAISRIDTAIGKLKSGDTAASRDRVASCQLIVAQLAAGVITDYAPEVSTNILRLYEYVAHNLAQHDSESLARAKDVLATLREGFLAIRPQAIELERTGQIPGIDSTQTVSTLA